MFGGGVSQTLLPFADAGLVRHFSPSENAIPHSTKLVFQPSRRLKLASISANDAGRQEYDKAKVTRASSDSRSFTNNIEENSNISKEKRCLDQDLSPHQHQTINVMTRDTQGLLDDRDGNDADVYAALWAAAPFPRIPNDAPAEMKKLTIDVDDPKRVYAIHHASRRHHFQILVERYILQLRYGCQNKLCTTITCFSCRKRLAAGAPVRRYNATSARTLAIYLSSQDNPEQGLCHSPSAERPIPQIKKVTKLQLKRDSAVGVGSNGYAIHAPAFVDGTTESFTPAGSPTWSRPKDGKVENNKRKSEQPSVVRVIDEVTRKDHKSFVQNVFGTVAFKMVEWLTPRNIEIMASAVHKEQNLANGNPSLSSTELSTPLSSPADGSEAEERRLSELEAALDLNDIHKDQTKKQDEDVLGSPKHHATTPTSNSHEEAIPCTSPNPRTFTEALPTRISNPNAQRTSETVEQAPKGVLNISASPKMIDSAPNYKALPRGFHSLPDKRDAQQTTISSRRIPAAATLVINERQTDTEVPGSGNMLSPGIISKLNEKAETELIETLNRILDQHQKPSERNVIAAKVMERKALPQSLSSLTIEIIDAICDILQVDDTAEKHSLVPERIGFLLKRHRNKKPLDRRTPPEYPSSAKLQWHSFIQQSLFYTLSKPESLLSSFANEQKRLHDSHTAWYLMLRMTRVAPSLVLDSLWMAAETLFHPPPDFESRYELPKESTLHPVPAKTGMSDLDAAKIINLCLHSLVAAVPLLKDERQLANMSRIRSYGQTMLGRSTMAALEPATLCLQYDDAFTNDLALRLARRVFAAIPTRRRFAELLKHQQGARSEEKWEIDIVETILSTLKYFSLGTPSTLNFSDEERNLHEKRVPMLILDWARTIMLQDWQGTAGVPADGPFGGALAMVAAIYKSRKSLLLGDIHFRTEYFSDRLDPVEMPLEWLNFESKRQIVHLLDYPYLFTPSTLVTYFRAINYSRMNQAYETAKATYGLMRAISSEGNLLTDSDRRRNLSDRLDTATTRYMVLEVSRNNVLRDTFNAIWRREERELMRPLKIRLGEDSGEEGLDSGGVQQEFFRLAIAEALNPDYGTFTIDDRTKMAWFQPSSPEPLWKFELIGMIISLAVYNGLTLPVTFPKALYQKLLDEDVSELHHIEDGWPDLANGLTTLLEWDVKDGPIEEIFTRTYEFSVEQFGQPISREMINSAKWPQFADLINAAHLNPTDAPLVTDENRNAYVSDYIRWLTDVSVRPQFEAFKSGFFACVDRRSITLFDPETLQSLVEGVQEIDVSELRRCAKYIGWEGNSSHRTIRDFWSIVKRYDLAQRKRLLEFVTASDRVPVGGMKNLQFMVQRNGVDDGHLPSSYTCYGVLLLPEYSSKEVLRQKLETALENSQGFGMA